MTITSAEAGGERVARDLGATWVAANRDAADGADIVVLAVPADAASDVAAEMTDVLAGRAVVDVTNRPTPDPERSACTSNAEEIQARVPEAHIVKALNTVFVARQADPALDGTPADGFVAGDDDAAKQVVLRLLESIGMRAFDVGPLAFARTLEGMGWMLISLAMSNGWTWQSAWKLVGPTTP